MCLENLPRFIVIWRIKFWADNPEYKQTMEVLKVGNAMQDLLIANNYTMQYTDY